MQRNTFSMENISLQRAFKIELARTDIRFDHRTARYMHAAARNERASKLALNRNCMVGFECSPENHVVRDNGAFVLFCHKLVTED